MVQGIPRPASGLPHAPRGLPFMGHSVPAETHVATEQLMVVVDVGQVAGAHEFAIAVAADGLLVDADSPPRVVSTDDEDG